MLTAELSTGRACCRAVRSTLAALDFLSLVRDGGRVFVTYQARITDGRRFRNTEIVAVRDGQIVDVEVYFGWSIPHQAAAGGFVTS